MRPAYNCLTRRSAVVTYHSPFRAISSVVERLLHTQEVAGSNPASRTIPKVMFYTQPTAAVPIVALASFALTFSGFAADRPEKLSAEAAFKAAAVLMKKGEHKQAIPYLKRVQKEL